MVEKINELKAETNRQNSFSIDRAGFEIRR